MLVGLLVRLGLDRRAAEIGLLLAAGFHARTVRRLLLSEGMILTAIGGLIGLITAVGYAALCCTCWPRWWPERSVCSFLTLHVNGISLRSVTPRPFAVSAVTIAGRSAH